MAGNNDNDDNEVDTVDDDKNAGYLEQVFTPETARTIKRAAPFVAIGLLALLVLRN